MKRFLIYISFICVALGAHADLDVFLLGRYQWASMKDSPKSGVLNVQTFRDNLHSGFAFTMAYDNLGVAKQMYNPKLAYDYELKLREDMVLTLGLSAGVQYGYFNAEKYKLEDESERTDGDFPDDKQTKVSPDFDLGVEFATPTILAGVSVTHLTEGESTTLKSSRHIYAYGRYIFNLNQNFDLVPALTWMHKEKVNVAELNVMAFFKRMFWGALTYHPDMSDGFSSNPVAVSAGLEFKNFRIGYCFDYNFGKVADYASSAHELMLSYSVRNKKTAPTYDRFE